MAADEQGSCQVRRDPEGNEFYFVHDGRQGWRASRRRIRLRECDHRLSGPTVVLRQHRKRLVDVDHIAAARPDDVIQLLPAFDQYVLGPGIGDPRVVPASRRAQLSRSVGWISPVVVTGQAGNDVVGSGRPPRASSKLTCSPMPA